MSYADGDSYEPLATLALPMSYHTKASYSSTIVLGEEHAVEISVVGNFDTVRT